jgi:hypothetical protein
LGLQKSADAECLKSSQVLVQQSRTLPFALGMSSHASSMCRTDVESVPASCFFPGTFRRAQRSSAEVFSHQFEDLQLPLAVEVVPSPGWHALDLGLKALYFGVRIIDNLVELTAEMSILVGEILAHCLVVQSAQVNVPPFCERVNSYTSLALFGTPKKPGHVQRIP